MVYVYSTLTAVAASILGDATLRTGRTLLHARPAPRREATTQ